MSTLGEFQRCTTCGEHDFVNKHRCKPIFYVLYPDYHGDDWEDAAKIHALDHERAAETWASRHDSEGSYTIVGGNDVLVSVRKHDEEPSEAATYAVTGETVPKYRARECDAERFKKGSYII
jgi:hypothetical protein